MHVDKPAHLPLLLELAETGRRFYQRNWVLGTSGNFSAVLSSDPLCLAITASGVHKGELQPCDFLIINDAGAVLEGNGKPSAETLLHLTILRSTGAGAVLHTHSVWATILSERYVSEGGFKMEGYEMLKGLSGVATYEHQEWLPVLKNTQDYPLLATEVGNLLDRTRTVHGFLLWRHGLYTWGKDVSEARRHVEILEFLLEVVGRKRSMPKE